jgi:hypothetical protein
VRFYFLDKETDTLVNATGCSFCTRPASAYDLGVSKYTDADRNMENGSIGDNRNGNWSYSPSPQVSIVPIDSGYYAEYMVKDFS